MEMTRVQIKRALEGPRDGFPARCRGSFSGNSQALAFIEDFPDLSICTSNVYG
jgi:hypothetical protein